MGEAPQNPYAFFFLGQAYFEKEDWGRALKAYVRALELSPEYLGARIGAGHVLRMMGKHREALRMARQALALAPDDSDALYLMAVVCFTRGDEADARRYLTRFLASGPEAEVALEAQGMLQVLGGEVLPYEGADGGPEDEGDGDEP